MRLVRRFAIDLLAVAVLAVLAVLIAIEVRDASTPPATRAEMPAACREVVLVADQVLIGAGQIVDDKNAARYANPLTAANFDAQLAQLRRRYDAARAACPVT